MHTAPTGAGRVRRSATRLEQPHLQLVLHLRDRPAQRLLDQVQPPRRAGEAQVLGDGDEVAQLSQLRGAHVRILSCSFHSGRW
jgi:hypothetical protein